GPKRRQRVASLSSPVGTPFASDASPASTGAPAAALDGPVPPAGGSAGGDPSARGSPASSSSGTPSRGAHGAGAGGGGRSAHQVATPRLRMTRRTSRARAGMAGF